MYSEKLGSGKVKINFTSTKKKGHAIFSLYNIFMIIMTWSCLSVSWPMNSSREFFVQCSIGFEAFIVLMLGFYFALDNRIQLKVYKSLSVKSL